MNANHNMWTNDPSKIDALNAYFATLNPMTARIIETRNRVKHSYSDETWNAMSVAEQEAAVNKTFMSPDVIARYKLTNKTALSDDIKAVFPRLVIDSGQELTRGLDNEEVEWRDVHSSPFSWKTKSQMNIRLPPPNSACGNTAKKSDVTDPINVSVEVTIPVIARKSEDLADRLKKEEKVVGNTDPKMDILLQRRSEPHSDLQKSAQSAPATQPLILRERPSKSKQPEGPTSYSRASRDQKKVLTSSKTKKSKAESSKFNPRSSLTLDEKEDVVDEKGAIRNLEFALREEQANRKQQSSEKSRGPDYVEIAKQDDVSSSSCSSLAGNETVEEDPLLKTPTFSSAAGTGNHLRKSGFDFLDNW